VELFSIGGGVARTAIAFAAEATEGGAEGGLAINLFWIIVASLNFIVFAVLLYVAFGGSVQKMLADRRARIAQGLADAEQARTDREKADQERQATLAEARREANEILARSQKVAQETRDADIAATKAELDRMRERAASEIEAQKQKALADLRAEVADLALAAAGRVVNETMTDARQRRLVEEFLAETADGSSKAKG
jgi:F-type H+-transporting ATPase subunit b